MANRPPVSLQTAIARGQAIISYGPVYSQGRPEDPCPRGTEVGDPGFDCSSFVGTCWNIPGRPATPSMAEVYSAYGFRVLSFPEIGLGGLKKGDVLVYNGPSGGAGNDGHTAWYVGNGLFMEASGGNAPGGGGHYSMAYAGVHGSIWQVVLRPNVGIYIVHWVPSDNLGGGF